MHILLAPDKFRGSLTAQQACDAMREGVALAAPTATTTALPLADGGEGTAHLLTQATNGQWHHRDVAGPLEKPVRAGFGLSGDGRTAYVELAQASGLSRLTKAEQNPLHTTTAGTGQLIGMAVALGATSVVLGIGGSATNDGGVGMAEALGWRFLDATGTPFRPVGGTLTQIVQLIPPALPLSASVRVACDVQNSLCGPSGASAVYGPQKGASPADVAQLEAGLQHLAELATNQLGTDWANVPGAGAAGGTGFGAMAFLNATLEPGVDLVLDVLRFEQHVADAALILTGEGKLDDQTLQGKSSSGVCRRAARHNVPVVALCGTLALTPEQIRHLGLTAAFSILNAPQPLEMAVGNAYDDLRRATFNVMRVFRN